MSKEEFAEYIRQMEAQQRYQKAGMTTEKAFRADMQTLQNVVQQVLVPAMRQQFQSEIKKMQDELKAAIEECRSVKQELEALRVAVMTVCLQGAGIK